MSDNEIMTLPWVHSIDLGNGVITPGKWGLPNPLILQVFDEIDFKGKKVLDIGCWDGLWSFEAEKRGAVQVYATDDISQRSFQNERPFLVAKEMLNSKVEYFPHTPVENVGNLPSPQFDIVLFLGVAYHLRDPLRALSILRNVTRSGGIIVVESAVYYEFRNSFANFFYTNSFHGDFSNWWIPTVRCLEEWVEACYFRKKRTYFYLKDTRAKMIWLLKAATWRFFPGRFSGRAVVVAEAFKGKDPRWVFPDAIFKEFDENDYRIQP